MSRTLIPVLAASLLLAAAPSFATSPGSNSGAAVSSKSSGTCTGQIIPLDFADPSDVKIFQFSATQGGYVSARSSDCCMFGPDIWRIGLNPVKASSEGWSISGTGALDVFTGRVYLRVEKNKSYQMIVSPDTIPAGYPAGMSVCLEGPVALQ